MASTPPPPGESDHPIYEDDDDEEEEDDDQNDDVVDLHVDDDEEEEEDVEIDVNDDSPFTLPPPSSSSSASLVTVAVLPAIPETKPPPPPQPLDESRRLFQRLWTDEDEIELLNGFLHYTNNRNGSHHHHDTTAFYDQVKCRLQLEFNKNQLVEKLRRLKKKYRNVVGKLSSGKDYVFKSPHDQATFEISKKIWSGSGTILAGGVNVNSEFDEDDHAKFSFVNSDNNLVELSDVGLGGGNGSIDVNSNINSNAVVGNHTSSLEKKVVRSRKRARSGGDKIEEKQMSQNNVASLLVDHHTPVGSVPIGCVPNLVEDTVRGCISPLFKELLNNVVNGSRSGFGGGVRMNGGGPMMMMPMGFGGVGGMDFGGVDVVDDKWRKQQILELEVYSKRLELLQEQVQSQLDELRSMGS